MTKFDEWRKRREVIRQLRNDGKTQVEIGKLFSISKQRVQQILTNNSSYERWCANLSPEERKERYLKHKEKRDAYNKQWRKANPKKVQSYVRRWEAKNPEKTLEMGRRSYYKNRKKQLLQQHTRYITDPAWRELRIEREKQRYIKNNLRI